MTIVRHTAAQLGRSRPFRLFASLVAAAYLVLLARGRADSVWVPAAVTVVYGLYALITVAVTRPDVAEPPVTSPRRAIGAQLAVIAGVIALTAWQPPWLDALFTPLRRLGEGALPAAWFGDGGNAVVNPTLYFVLPGLALLALGARPAETGFGRGHRVLQACLVWSAVPIVAWIGLVAAGVMPAQTVIRRLVGNALQNGFFEEFLFRGALFTRLRALIPAGWAAVAQSVVFGLWHIGANMRMLDGDLVAGVAWCVANQAV